MGISCEISLYPQPNGKLHEYQPGSTVSGAIKYLLDEAYEFNAVVVSLKGRGRLYFEDKHEKNNDRLHTYNNKESYVNLDNFIHKNTGKPLPAGLYETPFSFELPNDIPATLEYVKNALGYYCRCNIHYHLHIKFEKTGLFSLNKHFKKEINVVSGAIPRMTTIPLTYGEQKSLIQLTSLFTGQKSIVSIKATIANSVLRPGENVKVDYEVENNTSVDIKRVTVKFLEVDTYTSSGGRKVNVKSEVENTEFTYGSIKGGETAPFTAEITVPSLCASFDHSEMFGRDYAVIATVVLPLPHINLNLEIPFQVIDRLALNFEEGIEATAGCSGDAPPSYWEAMGEDKKDAEDQEDCHSSEEKTKENEKA